MRKTARNFFYVAFTIFFSLVILALGFFFFYYSPLFGQTIYWGDSSYTVGIHSVNVENGKTYISINIKENNPSRLFRYADDLVPDVEIYFLAFGRQYFGLIHRTERGRITFEFDFPVIPDIIFVHAGEQYNDFYTHISFDGRTKKPVRFFIPPENAVDLHTLLDQEKLRIIAVGSSIEYVTITFENISRTTLLVKSGIGTWLRNSDIYYQNMALITDIAFIAGPGKTYTLNIPAVCLNESRRTPLAYNTFTVERLEESEQLITILWESILWESSLSRAAHSRIQQRVWEAIRSDINSAWR